jgi:PAS domain S-box-containing protein
VDAESHPDGGERTNRAIDEQKVVDPFERRVIDALPRAIIVAGLDDRVLLWNRPAERLYGWRAEDTVGRLVTEILGPLTGPFDGAATWPPGPADRVWSGDRTVIRRDGEPVRVWLTRRPVLDAGGHVVAVLTASEDVTEQRLLAQRAEDLTAHLQLVLDAGGLGTFRWDSTTGAAEWDSRLEALHGLGPGSFAGTSAAWAALGHPDDAEKVNRQLRDAVARKERFSLEHRVVWPDGSVHWLHSSGRVTLDASGAVTGVIGCSADVTERVHTQEELRRLTFEAVAAADEERISRQRLEFLGLINDALAQSHNRREAMRNVVRAAVPSLGDWCAIHVLPPGADARVTPEVEVAHTDPDMVAYAHELQQRFPYDPAAATGIANVLRSGKAEFFPVITPEVLDEIDAEDQARDVVRQLELRSALTVQLVKWGRVLGALQLVMTGSGRIYNHDDLALAKAAADRIASSLENLRLVEEQRNIAATLQAALLPASLPDVPGVELAVRYWAAGEGVEVGGDFYDAFQVDEATWGLAIGDVCGTGPQAAAVTALGRHTIAAAAWHGDEPAEVLRMLNRSLRARRTDRFCTVAYGRLENRAEGPTLTIACGGHPLPLLVRPDGTVQPCGRPGTLIGVLDEVRVQEVRTVLAPGDAVVFFTDGLTDAKPPHNLSEAQFAKLVGEAARDAGSADDIADAIRAEVMALRPLTEDVDDMALLIVRASVPER